MRILALDHGEARVGAASCDPTETIASPAGVLGPDPAEAEALVDPSVPNWSSWAFR